MADGDNSNVNIEIGATSKVADTTDGILDEFERMADMLRKVGTEDARDLEKNLRNAMEALNDGASSKGLEEMAVAFSQVKDYSKLSDKAIGDLSTKMDNAVKKSRGLSDAMKKSSDGGGIASRAVNAMSSALDRLSPKASSITSSVGQWAQKIPGVSNLMAKMPGLASALGLAFKGVTAAIVGAYEAFVELNAKVMDAREKYSRWASEDADETKKQRMFEADQKERERKEEERKAQALADAEHLASVAEAKKMHEDTMREGGDIAAPIRREEMEMKYRQATEIHEKDKAGEDLQRSYDAKAAERESIEERRKAAIERRKAIEDDMKARRKDMAELDEQRSESQKRAEKKARELGLEGAAFTEYVNVHALDAIGDTLGDKVKDFGAWSKRMGAMLGIETSGSKLSVEDATKLFEARREKDRQQNRELAELNREIAGYDAGSATVGRDLEILQRQKDANEKERQALEAAQLRERTQKGRELKMNIDTKRVENMAEGNRLTAMGLGGGDVSYRRDIAGGVKSLVEIAKEIRANTHRGLMPEGWERKPLTTNTWAM